MPSASYILTRVLQIIPTFLFIMVVVFVLVRLLPGDPASAILGERATDEAVERINAQLGLDRPLPVQFALFLERFLEGDLGSSIHLKVPVSQLIEERLPVTLMLTAYAALLAVLLALPLAFVAALRQGRGADAMIRGAFQVGLSMPVFYIGLVLLTIFAARLRWFPVGGFGDTLADRLYHLFLPALTLALSLSAVLMRLSIGTLIGGAVITETVFAIPGAGRLMIDSIYGRDYPVVQGLTMVLAILVSLVFLITDLIQAALDPRIGR